MSSEEQDLVTSLQLGEAENDTNDDSALLQGSNYLVSVSDVVEKHGIISKHS